MSTTPSLETRRPFPDMRNDQRSSTFMHGYVVLISTLIRGDCIVLCAWCRCISAADCGVVVKYDALKFRR
jgi:hypothetical protein